MIYLDWLIVLVVFFIWMSCFTSWLHIATFCTLMNYRPFCIITVLCSSAIENSLHTNGSSWSGPQALEEWLSLFHSWIWILTFMVAAVHYWLLMKMCFYLSGSLLLTGLWNKLYSICIYCHFLSHIDWYIYIYFTP